MTQTKEISDIYDIATTKCSCGCGILKLSAERDNSEETIIVSYYPFGFYAYQPIYAYQPNGWLTRLKNVWKILTGKEYQLYEVIIDNPEEISNFKQNLRDFLEKN